MGIQNVDRTLPSNQMVFELRRDAEKFRKFQNDMEASMEDFGLTPAEREAWRNMDIAGLGALGVHPYFLPQVSRLFKGGGYNHNDSDAARLYAEKMGILKEGS
ncbi:MULTISPECIES: hypothetical protein [Alcaligenaceae]|jgi:hypothetical protein|uniref:Extradiol ring-cleavage dioxygenase LigAB LigA subunit domain-containing protein n=1 Tax=Neopusillimonas maritima TaxID=2026239 RepID=A0ABX9MVS4_9BURK|nr:MULTISPECIES: hypothetical protein [Alcaligenaceae]QIM47741.1 hypothetical protein G9Q38_00385 [Pusillimonas sp. DMV24BSW_D]RII83054.1 hypothetical protein CJO09_05415 [Neopusillimonas maritima]|tara:strand:- start:1001 stop:1309 length:309 start_codon:yes stop_codon:yes gene_type:complete